MYNYVARRKNISHPQCQQEHTARDAKQAVGERRAAQVSEKFVYGAGKIIRFVLDAKQMPELGADDDERCGRRERIGHRY